MKGPREVEALSTFVVKFRRSSFRGALGALEAVAVLLVTGAQRERLRTEVDQLRRQLSPQEPSLEELVSLFLQELAARARSPGGSPSSENFLFLHIEEGTGLRVGWHYHELTVHIDRPLKKAKWMMTVLGPRERLIALNLPGRVTGAWCERVGTKLKPLVKPTKQRKPPAWTKRL